MRRLAALIRRSRRCESGAELIEFALTFPVLLFVVLGILEFGLVFSEYEVVNTAAREGARIAVLPPPYQVADAQARATQYLVSRDLDLARATVPAPVMATEVLTPGRCITTMTVTVQYQHPMPLLSGIANYFGGTFGTLTLNGSSTMRREMAAVAC